MENEAILCKSCKNKVFFHDSGYFFCNWCDQESLSEVESKPCPPEPPTPSPSKRARKKRRNCKACGAKKFRYALGRYYCKCNGKFSDFVRDAQEPCGKTNSSKSCESKAVNNKISNVKTGTKTTKSGLTKDSDNLNRLTIDEAKADSDKSIKAKLPDDTTKEAIKKLQDLKRKQKTWDRNKALFEAFFKAKSQQISREIAETKRNSSIILMQDDSELSDVFSDKADSIISPIKDKSPVKRRFLRRLEAEGENNSGLNKVDGKDASILSNSKYNLDLSKDDPVLSKANSVLSKDNSVLSKIKDKDDSLLSKIENKEDSLLSKIEDEDDLVLSKIEEEVESFLCRMREEDIPGRCDASSKVAEVSTSKKISKGFKLEEVTQSSNRRRKRRSHDEEDLHSSSDKRRKRSLESLINNENNQGELLGKKSSKENYRRRTSEGKRLEVENLYEKSSQEELESVEKHRRASTDKCQKTAKLNKKKALKKKEKVSSEESHKKTSTDECLETVNQYEESSQEAALKKEELLKISPKKKHTRTSKGECLETPNLYEKSTQEEALKKKEYLKISSERTSTAECEESVNPNEESSQEEALKKGELSSKMTHIRTSTDECLETPNLHEESSQEEALKKKDYLKISSKSTFTGECEETAYSNEESSQEEGLKKEELSSKMKHTRTSRDECLETPNLHEESSQEEALKKKDYLKISSKSTSTGECEETTNSNEESSQEEVLKKEGLLKNKHTRTLKNLYEENSQKDVLKKKEYLKLSSEEKHKRTLTDECSREETSKKQESLKISSKKQKSRTSERLYSLALSKSNSEAENQDEIIKDTDLQLDSSDKQLSSEDKTKKQELSKAQRISRTSERLHSLRLSESNQECQQLSSEDLKEQHKNSSSEKQCSSEDKTKQHKNSSSEKQFSSEDITKQHDSVNEQRGRRTSERLKLNKSKEEVCKQKGSLQLIDEDRMKKQISLKVGSAKNQDEVELQEEALQISSEDQKKKHDSSKEPDKSRTMQDFSEEQDKNQNEVERQDEPLQISFEDQKKKHDSSKELDKSKTMQDSSEEQDKNQDEVERQDEPLRISFGDQKKKQGSSKEQHKSKTMQDSSEEQDKNQGEVERQDEPLQISFEGQKKKQDKSKTKQGSSTKTDKSITKQDSSKEKDKSKTKQDSSKEQDKSNTMQDSSEEQDKNQDEVERQVEPLQISFEDQKKKQGSSKEQNKSKTKQGSSKEQDKSKTKQDSSTEQDRSNTTAGNKNDYDEDCGLQLSSEDKINRQDSSKKRCESRTPASSKSGLEMEDGDEESDQSSSEDKIKLSKNETKKRVLENKLCESSELFARQKKKVSRSDANEEKLRLSKKRKNKNICPEEETMEKSEGLKKRHSEDNRSEENKTKPILGSSKYEESNREEFPKKQKEKTIVLGDKTKEEALKTSLLEGKGNDLSENEQILKRKEENLLKKDRALHNESASTIIQDTTDTSSCEEFYELGIKLYSLSSKEKSISCDEGANEDNFAGNECTLKNPVVAPQISLPSRSFSDLLIPNNSDSFNLPNDSSLQSSTLQSSDGLQIDVSLQSPEKLEGTRRVSSRIAAKLSTTLQNSSSFSNPSCLKKTTSLSPKELGSTKPEIQSPIPQGISENLTFESGEPVENEALQNSSHRLIQNLAKTPRRSPSVQLATPREGNRIRFQSVTIKSPWTPKSVSSPPIVAKEQALHGSSSNIQTSLAEVKSDANRSLESNKWKDNFLEEKDIGYFEGIEESNIRECDEILANFERLFGSSNEIQAFQDVGKEKDDTASPRSSSANNEENNNDSNISTHAVISDSNFGNLADAASMITSTPIAGNKENISGDDRPSCTLTPSARRMVRTCIKQKMSYESNQVHEVQTESMNQLETESLTATSEKIEDIPLGIRVKQNQPATLNEELTKFTRRRPSISENSEGISLEIRLKKNVSAALKEKSTKASSSAAQSASSSEEFDLQSSQNIKKLKSAPSIKRLKRTAQRRLSLSQQSQADSTGEHEQAAQRRQSISLSEQSQVEHKDNIQKPPTRSRRKVSKEKEADVFSMKPLEDIISEAPTKLSENVADKPEGTIQKPARSRRKVSKEKEADMSSVKLPEDIISGAPIKLSQNVADKPEDTIQKPATRSHRIMSKEKEADMSSMKLPEDIVSGESTKLSENVVDKPEDAIRKPATRSRRNVPKEKEADMSSMKLPEDIISGAPTKLSGNVADKPEDTNQKPPTRSRRNVSKEKEADVSSMKLPEDIISEAPTKLSENVADKPEDTNQKPAARSRRKVSKGKEADMSSMKLPEDIISGAPTKLSGNMADKPEDTIQKPARSRRKVSKEKEADMSSMKLPENIISGAPTKLCKNVVDKPEDAIRKPATRTRRNVSKEKEADVSSMKLPEDIISGAPTKLSENVADKPEDTIQKPVRSRRKVSKDKEADVSSMKLPEDIISGAPTKLRENVADKPEDAIRKPATRTRRNVSKEKEADVSSMKLPEDIISGAPTKLSENVADKPEDEKQPKQQTQADVTEENEDSEEIIAIPGPSALRESLSKEKETDASFMKPPEDIESQQSTKATTSSISMQIQVQSNDLSSIPNTESIRQLGNEVREENSSSTKKKRVRSESKTRSRKSSEGNLEPPPKKILRRRNTHAAQENSYSPPALRTYFSDGSEDLYKSESESSSTTWSSLETEIKRPTNKKKRTTNKRKLPKKKTLTVKKPRKSVKAKITKITTWDCYNYILLGLVKEMIALGANEKLKGVVKVLWFKYLKKIEVLHDDPTKPPKLQLLNSQIDAEILYGMSRGSSDECPDVTEPEKGRYSRHNKSLGSFSYTSKSKRFHYSSIAKTELKKVMPSKEVLNETISSSRSIRQMVTYRDLSSIVRKPVVLTKTKLYGLIYLGLLITRDKIKLGDILRFIQEGSLSFNSLEHFLPENIDKSALGHYGLNRANAIISSEGLRKKAAELVEFIAVENLIPAVSFYEVVERYCQELNLPDEFVQYIHKLIYKTKPKLELKKSAKVLPNYDARAISFVIFGLKILFGLDGATEFELSKTATTLGSNAFNFKDWFEHICSRRLFINGHHFPSYFKSTVGGAEVPSLYANYMRNIGLEDASQFYQQQFLEAHLENFPINEAETYTFDRSLTPHRDFARKFAKASQHQSEILLRDFKDASVKYLYDPEVYKDYTVEVKHRGAHENIEFVPLAIHEPTFGSRTINCTLSEKHIIPNSSVEEVDSRKILNDYHRYHKPKFEKFERQFENSQGTKKKITMYNPAECFWINLKSIHNLTNEAFNDYFNSLPGTFQQIVQECAQIIQQPTKDILIEYNILETYICNIDKPKCFGCLTKDSLLCFLKNYNSIW